MIIILIISLISIGLSVFTLYQFYWAEVRRHKMQSFLNKRMKHVEEKTNKYMEDHFKINRLCYEQNYRKQLQVMKSLSIHYKNEYKNYVNNLNNKNKKENKK